jgi:hypothetical protein
MQAVAAMHLLRSSDVLSAAPLSPDRDSGVFNFHFVQILRLVTKPPQIAKQQKIINGFHN